ncbi:MAG: hypothetical protein IT384_11505 [Deltaproteobacteria bacterium]|nr:hypothetical protein [Deltaproteobacteria bacterium]
MSYLPEPDEQDWILEHLAEIIHHRGAGVFLNAPIIEPTERYFPRRWTPTETSVRAMIVKLLRIAGLRFSVRLEIFDAGATPSLNDRGGNSACPRAGETAAWFAGLDAGEAHFGVELGQLTDPLTLAGTLCHEVAHAYRAAHGITYYERELDEPLTDLTTIYLGFGLLTTQSSYHYTSSAEGYSHHRRGYMTALPMSFALAAQSVARKMDKKARKRLAEHLGPNQAAYFLAGAKALESPERALDERLGLSTARGVAGPGPNQGLVVFRVRSGILRAFRCSDPGCAKKLRRDDTICPGCGGTIAGEARSEAEAAEQEASLLRGAEAKDELTRLLRGGRDGKP